VRQHRQGDVPVPGVVPADLVVVLVPTAILLGLVAVVLGAANLRRGRERLSSTARGMTAAGLAAGVVCLLLTLLSWMGVIHWTGVLQ
jgi:hypothetical protein